MIRMFKSMANTGNFECQQCHTNYHAMYREHEVNQDTLNMYLTENKSDKE